MDKDEKIAVPVQYLLNRLITTCETGNMREVNFLMQFIPNYIKRFTYNDFNPLMSAIFANQNNIVYQMLAHSAVEYNVQDLSKIRNQYESTPLHVAVYKMNQQAVHYLVAHAQHFQCVSNLVNALDCWGKTPLHHAVYHNNLPAVSLLLDLQETDTDIRDSNDKKAIDYCQFNKPDILEEFHRRGLCTDKSS